MNIGEDLSCVGVISFTFVDESNLICQCDIATSDLANDQGDKWHDCNYEGETVGKVLITSEYEHPPAPEEEEEKPSAPPVQVIV